MAHRRIWTWVVLVALALVALGATVHGDAGSRTARTDDTAVDRVVAGGGGRGAGAAGGAGAGGDAAGAVPAAAGRPNIVVIMTDDMRQDDLRFMPWTRTLIGDRGARFVNSFSPYPLCCPARASVLTGKYTHNHGVYQVYPPWAFPSFHDGRTIATALRGSGYATIYLGKYLNGYGYLPRPGARTGTSVHYVPPGWTSWRASIDGGLPATNPAAGGTYHYFDTTLSTNGTGFANYRGRYQSDVYGDLTAQIIRYRAARPQPFFLYVSYTAPHFGQPTEPDDPVSVLQADGRRIDIATPARPDRVKGRFDDVVKQAPGASWHDPDFSDKPGYLRSRPPLNAAVRAAVRSSTRQRAEALSVVDQQVRRTIASLRASGELAHTLVVFTSDNGYFLGEQRLPQGKKWPHEPSLRVPLLMRGPGIPAGVRRHDPFTSIDYAPTLAQAAGITLPWTVDGISLLGVARHGDTGWSRAVLTESGQEDGLLRDTDLAGNPLTPGATADLRYTIGIRTSRYLYVDIATGAHELYDLATDPNEYVNLARDPAHAAVRALLRAELQRMRACRGVACQAPMAPPLRAGG